MIGFIYIMSNPAYPGDLKIGQTKNDPEERRKELGSTGVLHDYVLEYRALSEEYESLEREIHRSLAKQRVRPDREFFTISVPEAINKIREIAGDRIESDKVFYISPEELLKAEEEKQKAYKKAKAYIEKRNKELKQAEDEKAKQQELANQAKRIHKEVQRKAEESEKLKIKKEEEQKRLDHYNKVFKPPKNILILPFWVVWFPFNWFWYITDDEAPDLPLLIVLLAYFAILIYTIIFLFLIILPINYLLKLIGID